MELDQQLLVHIYESLCVIKHWQTLNMVLLEILNEYNSFWIGSFFRKIYQRLINFDLNLSDSYVFVFIPSHIMKYLVQFLLRKCKNLKFFKESSSQLLHCSTISPSSSINVWFTSFLYVYNCNTLMFNPSK